MAPEPNDGKREDKCGKHEPAQAAPASKSDLIRGAQGDSEQRPGGDPDEGAGGGGDKEKPEWQPRRSSWVTNEAAHDGNEPTQEDTPGTEAPEALLGGKYGRRGRSQGMEPAGEAPRGPNGRAGNP